MIKIETVAVDLRVCTAYDKKKDNVFEGLRLVLIKTSLFHKTNQDLSNKIILFK